MSVTMTKAEGVTVFTMTSNHKSSWPPICQILGALCYSPRCCSVSQLLRRAQGSSQSALGTMQIMIGLLNIGLAAILYSAADDWWWWWTIQFFPFWFGGLFIAFGIVCILSEKFPNRCLVIINVMLNLAGVAFTIAAIVIYSLNLANTGGRRACQRNGYYSYYRQVTPPPTPSYEERAMQEKCEEGRVVVVMLLRSLSVVLIVASVLQLCVTISSAVLGIKSLRRKEKDVNQSADDPEQYTPLLEEVTTKPTA
ncbi:uncharacterized protein ACN63O_002000 [Diretmus argenteus]